MKLIFLTFLISLSIITNVNAQKEQNNWYFGYYAAITFNTTPPSALLDSKLFTTEGCATISDKNGNLLFYTDGVKIWNKNNEVMPHGDSLKGGASSTQSVLIVPVPDADTKYYVFTVQMVNDYPDPLTFRYSVVDMFLDGGLGDVDIAQKNIILEVSVTEKLCAVKHSNKQDVWIMVHGYNNKDYKAFLLTPIGITGPVVTTIGDTLRGAAGVGQTKFSTDGTRYANAVGGRNYVDLYDFDAGTGVISNRKHFQLPWLPHPQGANAGAYGLEFSPSGRYLYLSVDDSTKIFQFDLSSNDEATIASTMQVIGVPTSGSAMQLANDGKIYVAIGSSEYLEVIDKPEMLGLQSNFMQNGVYLGGSNRSSIGLPNFIASYFIQVGTNELNPESAGSIYPKLVQNKLTINLGDNHLGKYIIRLHDLAGRLIIDHVSTAMNNKIEIDLSHISKGVYIVSVLGEHVTFNEKVVVD